MSEAAYSNRCRAVISLDSIAANVSGIRGKMEPGCVFMGVVKADAYGHGDIMVSKELERSGAGYLGVSCFDEAIYLRENGIRLPVLIFGPTEPGKAAEIARNEFAQTVHSADYANKLHRACAESGVKITAHIKVDTGMGRLGFTDTGEILKAVSLESFDAEGIFTHFACADEDAEDSRDYTKQQFDRFCHVIDELALAGVSFKLRHCCNSAAAIRYPNMHMDMVRCGIATYGLYPGDISSGEIELSPAISLYSTVASVKQIDAGMPVSYGRIFTAKNKMTVADVSIGYADGYPRALSNAGRMIVRGQSARVIGRVCMDQLMLDVTHIDGVREGDAVTVIGKDGENAVSIDEIAGAASTISYECACLIGKRIPRVYVRGGREIALRDYINRK